GDPVVFRVSGSLAVKLAEMPDIVERDRRLSHGFILGVDSLYSGEMKHGPQQHRGVTIRQHEAITIGPDRILWIEAEDAIPDRVDKWSQRHGCAGMSGLSLLHGVDRKRADGVDAQLIELCGA